MYKFLSTLVKTNKTKKYYFDEMDILELRSIQSDIDKLDKLIGNKYFDEDLKNILIDTPDLIKIIPLLIAYRDKNDTLDLLIDYSSEVWETITYSFELKNIDEEKILSIVDFCDKIGIKDFFINANIRSAYDFILGNHLGLRSNARKNKSGDFMESYVNDYISNMCTKNNLKFLSQARAQEIFNSFNIDIKNILNGRVPDFVINNNGKLILIEVNFYNAIGSKIKSTTNEYIKLNKELKNNPYIQDFIWITDGYGWHKSKKVLELAFDNIENVINIHNMNNGYIEKKVNLIQFVEEVI